MAFGIGDEDLFEPNDLFELSNFSQVSLCFIHALSLNSTEITAEHLFPS